MRILGGELLLSATDVANHLSCAHLTALNLQVARGEIDAPAWEDPHLAVLQQRGMEHERAYLSSLSARGLAVLDLTNRSPQDTLDAMRQGVPVIYQGTLATGQWGGRTDVLLRVERPSGFGEWSYEVVDCKLASETKAETAMQLCLYSALLERLQGRQPELFHVIRPNVDFQPESYRTAAYAAYFRVVKQSLEHAVTADTRDTYPEPVDHCEMCRWWKRCDTQRRRDDHLSFVAGVSRLQRKELAKHEVGTLRQLAALPLPVPFAPDRGSREGYVRIREQARVQFEAREESLMKFERLDLEAGKGLYRLPAPSRGDIFLDFEGDPFVEGGGLEYLTGILTAEGYEGRWAVDREEECRAFEWLIDFAMERWTRCPDLHIYHFGAYEPGAVKRLMLRYATREEEVDRLLRGEKFVDLHAIVKQSVRASVEQYSLKDVERLFEFQRQVPLQDASKARHFVEHQLELGSPRALGDSVKSLVERYNDDDCRSTECLRAWLEEVRSGLDIPRPVSKEAAPSEEVSEAQQKVAEVFAALTSNLPAEPSERNAEQAARWLLAHALDWHRREDKVKWWEFFRLKGLVEEDLSAEKQGLAGLSYIQRLPKSKPRERNPIDRYSYPPQECSIRAEGPVYTLDGERFGEVQAIDTDARTIDVKKPGKLDNTHPPAIFAHRHVDSKELSSAVLRLAQWIVEHGIDAEGEYRAARDLLLRKAPRPDDGVLPIQGPPGAGKTYQGARMIGDWIGKGKRVGVTAVSHKVIDNLLSEVMKATAGAARCAHLDRNGEDGAIRRVASPEEALALLQSREVEVMGGTAWMWARPEFAGTLDVLVVDEAGQMSLANVLACAGAARMLVLLGDPQQLEQPQQGSHPEGSDVSALAHLLDGAKTISTEQGQFLGQTWRLHPDLCAYTSEMFYERRLTSIEGLDGQRIDAGDFLGGAGLWWAPVVHEGNQSHSEEEIEVVAWMLERLTQAGATWVNREGERRPLTQADVLIVAPYNDQVSRLKDRLPGARVGTVDKFQGQEAAVVLYSMTSSSPEDAPRGMEFLYNLNRFNVATSRAKCACIVIGSPKLFAPACRTPRQIELANALCRYAELSGRLRAVEQAARV